MRECKLYDNYKDSTIAWVGGVPSHWSLKKSKFIFKEKSAKGHPNETLLSVLKGKGLLPRNELEFNTVMAFKDLENFKLVEKNSFVIHLRSFQSGFEMSQVRGIVSPAYSVFKLRKQGVPVYYKYLFYSKPFIEFIASTTLSLRDGKPISYQHFSAMLLPLPSDKEQKAIANFLDHKTSEIDALITDKEKLIELLKEQRQAIITETVTKGLNPDVKMKDSGIEWIGEIPEHWEVYTLKDLAAKDKNSFVDGPFGSDLKNEEYKDEGIPLIQLNNIGIGSHLLHNLKFINEEKAEQLTRHKAFPGDIVIAKMAHPVARATMVNNSYNQYVIVADCVRLKPNNDICKPEYVVYVINATCVRTQAESMATGTTRKRVNLSTIKKFFLFLPPLIEQIEIVNFLNKQSHNINLQMEMVQSQIQKLKEYRQSLIYEAVTGKIDVRNWADKPLERSDTVANA